MIEINNQLSLGDNIPTLKELQKSAQNNTRKNYSHKVELPFSLFIANILLVILIFCSNFYYIFSWQGKQSKGIWNLFISVYSILVFVPTVILLGSFRTLLKILLILDKIILVYFIAMASFYGLISIVENGNWAYTSLKVGFVVQGLTINILFKLMLLQMKWSKIHVIIYKLALFVNCSLLVFLSGYYLTTNFSLTRYHLPAFDNKVTDFMMFFLFGLFTFQFQMYSKISQLDYTDIFKSIYRLKDLPLRQQKREGIKSNRKLTIKSLNKIISKKQIQLKIYQRQSINIDKGQAYDFS